MVPVSVRGGKSHPGLKELRDEVRASRTGRPDALDQSPGAGDLDAERKGEGREPLRAAGRDCWGEGHLQTKVFGILPLAKLWRRGGRE